MSGNPAAMSEAPNAQPARALPPHMRQTASTPSPATQSNGPAKKKKKHRGGKKRRNRRQSFAASAAGTDAGAAPAEESFYQLGRSGTGNLSNTSLESEALLDHREQQHYPPRRQSTATGPTRPYASRNSSQAVQDSEDEEDTNDRTPLISSPGARRPGSRGFGFGYGGGGGEGSANRRPSNSTSVSSRRKRGPARQTSFGLQDYDVNNPPSVPASPVLGPEEPLLTEPHESSRSMVIDIDNRHASDTFNIETSPSSPRKDGTDGRRRTIALPAEGDVCFPVGGMSELGEEDVHHLQDELHREPRRKRGRQWPDLSALDEWSREEKEERSDGARTKTINEPMLVAGRLRPRAQGWHRAEEDAPYRFTYFNEEFPSTIHSQTISELVQPGQSFRELFIPDPPELSDDSDSDDEPSLTTVQENGFGSKPSTRHSSIIGEPQHGQKGSSGEATPSQQRAPGGGGGPGARPKRYGDRPTFWLDVLSPSDEEMRVLSKTFAIHPLTTEDIMTQEAREKVELFRNYYFVNYRTFEQDSSSEDFLEPINVYAVVFREGVITFHFSMIPHPANVRRRIRQLKDYLILSSDWISYALIDDITDVFAPRIQAIEEEVDDIDDSILRLHSNEASDSSAPTGNAASSIKALSKDTSEKKSEADVTTGDKGADMLRRVGDCRKRVMGLYRLLGNKPDVIKGFAKRCNEHWEVAPRSEIGLFLGDIQDHVVTMTGNLSHYEKILSRSHSNYLAQINIRMNERQEQTADVLGRLTVLGTIVLPMNIITGLWGMNCLVPGQDVESLTWFWCITAGLLCFGFACYFIAKRVYGIM